MTAQSIKEIPNGTTKLLGYAFRRVICCSKKKNPGGGNIRKTYRQSS
jgi:hypothetical protein